MWSWSLFSKVVDFYVMFCFVLFCFVLFFCKSGGVRKEIEKERKRKENREKEENLTQRLELT